MSALDTFTQYPLAFNPETSDITSADASLAEHLPPLSMMSRALSQLPAGIPPPPVPVPPQRSAAIEKLRQAGNNAFRKSSFAEAAQLYTHALELALSRPPWEPAPLLKEELSVLYNNRAQAYISLQSWPEALADANMAVDLKRVQNAKGHWRRGKALLEMGRLEEARRGLELGIEFGGDKELEALLKEVTERMERKGIKA